MGAKLEGGKRTSSTGVATALNTAGQRTSSSPSKILKDGGGKC